MAITAGASADVGTLGADAGASAGMKDAKVVGTYNKGMAVFTIVKAGLMDGASLEGERFSFEARSRTQVCLGGQRPHFQRSVFNSAKWWFT